MTLWWLLAGALLAWCLIALVLAMTIGSVVRIAEGRARAAAVEAQRSAHP